MSGGAHVLELRVLGPLEARHGGEPLALGGAKPRALLVDLLLHLGAVVSVDRLVDDLWAERPPASAGHAIEVYVSQLRKVLDPERTGVLSTRAGGYVLDIDPERVDARRFERLLGEGRTALADGDAGRAAAHLANGLELWRGPPLADLAYEPFAQHEIARLEELRVGALETRIEAELALGRARELVGELEALVSEHPFRERLRGQLMLALYRSGRQADALTVYRMARKALVEELGVEPGPELRALESAILRQDESLLSPVPPRELVPPARAQRRLVTILSADVVPAAGGEPADLEALQSSLERFVELASTAVAEHGGTMQGFSAETVTAAFGLPVAHEDDSLRAARAAVAIVGRLAGLNEDLERELGLRLDSRIGLATGEVVTGSAFATGAAVTAAGRLRQLAAAGEIVVADLARRLIAHAARLEPVGRPEAAEAFRVLDVAAEAPPFARRLDGPFVGRARELARLEEAFGRVVRTRTPRAVTVLGAAGIGKSRLAGELRSLVAANAAFLVGRCLPYGQGVTFWPVRSIVSEGAGSHSRQAIVAALADVDDADSVAESLSAALGPEAPPTTTEQIAWAFRLFCESLARRRPLVLVLDDLHWAEPPFLDLVENLVDRSCDAPMLVLCLAREDLLDDGSSFLQNQERAETLLLEALEADESEALAEALCTESGLPPEIQSRMVAGAEGNPLFLEQLVALAAEEGGAAAEQPLPATIQALLLARLDRLGPGERGVLERAAVIGREFRREPLAELVEPAGIAHLRRHLDVLVLRGFVRQEGFEPAYHEAFRFRHALIQAAVYGGTAKALRARLHEGYARWLAARSGLGEAELDTVMGYHLEQAHRHRSALGPTDDHTRALALEAGSRLGSAGIRSWKSGDARSSTNLLRRATTLLPATDTRRGELLCELGVALGAEGDSADAQDVLREALSSGADRRVELRARIELAYLHLLDRPLEGPDELLDVVSSAIPLLDELGDDRALGRAWLLAGFVRGAIRCQHAAWLENAERALGHHERSGWPTAACIGQIAAALYYGPAFVTAAIIRCSELRRDAPTDRVAEAHLHVFLGGLEAQRGHFDGARELVRIGRDVYDDLGYTRLNATHGGTVTADIALLAGDPAAAETELRSTCETLLEMRDLSNLATHAADLAEALYAQGHDDAAEAWTRISETHAGPDDLTAQPSWRSIRAKVLARRGDVPGAEALARDALRLADRTDALNARAKVELDLAETLRLAGRLDESATHVTRAVRLYDLKGNTAAARTARSLLEEPATA